MKHTYLIYTFLAYILCTTSNVYSRQSGKFRVLLIGDSTTAGNTPRLVKPAGPHLEQLITQLMSLETDMPPIETINSGKGGETALSVLKSGRYAKEIAPYIKQGIDYIFVRYGINDWYRYDDVKKEFPEYFRTLLRQLRRDFPEAKIVPMTIVPFLKIQDSKMMNKMIYQVAHEERLPVLDIFTPYQKYLDEQGPNTLNVRGIHLDSIPKKYQSWFKSRTFLHKSRKKRYMEVRADDNRLDPILGDHKEWFADRHPNLAGYHLISLETVRYLLNDLRKQR